jgi:hypothetical protein
MENLLEEIQQEILKDVPLSKILKKAKVLAYKLDSPEFKQWVELELNGYSGGDKVPQYRKLTGVPKGQFANAFRSISSLTIPMMNLPEWMRDWNEITFAMGVAQLEELMAAERSRLNKTDSKGLSTPWPGELLPFLSNTIVEGYSCFGAWTDMPLGAPARVLDAIRTKLQTFVLELEDRYPDLTIPGFKKPARPAREAIGAMATYIFHEGASMTNFNQQGQRVHTQYNAGRDINFSSVASRDDLVGALEQFKTQIEAAAKQGELPDEQATDAGYQVTKAIQQAKKPDADKQSILSHLGNVKTILEGVAAGAALLPVLQQAIESVSKLFS